MGAGQENKRRQYILFFHNPCIGKLWNFQHPYIGGFTFFDLRLGIGDHAVGCAQVNTDNIDRI